MAHTKLFLAVEPEITKNDDDLADQRDPKRRGSHWTARDALREIPSPDVGEYSTRSDRVGSSRPSDHDADRTNNLCQDECRTYVET